METKYISVDGIRTRYLEAGRGETLFLLHGGHPGLYTSANMWDPNIPLFARDFHVLAVDKLACGFTDNPKDDRDYLTGSVVRHAADFLRAVRISSVHLVGHSRGGLEACRLALEYPDMVKTLTIVNSGSLVMRTVPMTLHEKHRTLEIADAKERFRRKLLDFSFSDAHLTDEFIEKLLQIAALPKSKVATAKMEGSLEQRFVEDLIVRQQETTEWIKAGKLKAPTLIVWGFNDPAAKLDPRGLDVMKLFFSLVPESQMCILNRAGHYSFREQPAAFVAAVTEFIRANRPQSGNDNHT